MVALKKYFSKHRANTRYNNGRLFSTFKSAIKQAPLYLVIMVPNNDHFHSLIIFSRVQLYRKRHQPQTGFLHHKPVSARKYQIHQILVVPFCTTTLSLKRQQHSTLRAPSFSCFQLLRVALTPLNELAKMPRKFATKTIETILDPVAQQVLRRL